MAIEISSKSGLQSLASQLSSEVSSINSTLTSLQSVVNGASDYDGINVSGPASILASNLQSVAADLEAASANIVNYAAAVNELDTDDFNIIVDEDDSISLDWYDSTTQGFNGVTLSTGTTNGTVDVYNLSDTTNSTTTGTHNTESYSSVYGYTTNYAESGSSVVPAMWCVNYGDEVYYPTTNATTGSNLSGFDTSADVSTIVDTPSTPYANDGTITI